MQLLSRLERLVSSRRLVEWLKRLVGSTLGTYRWLRRYARTFGVELSRGYPLPSPPPRPGRSSDSRPPADPGAGTDRRTLSPRPPSHAGGKDLPAARDSAGSDPGDHPGSTRGGRRRPTASAGSRRAASRPPRIRPPDTPTDGNRNVPVRGRRSRTLSQAT